MSALPMRPSPRQRHPNRGFTLVEVLVALFILSLVALLSWRALDGMVRVQDQVFGHSDTTLALQSGLAQWSDDLDQVRDNGLYNSVDFDGRALRLTRAVARTSLRSGNTPASASLQVVAWALVNDDSGALGWQRWTSDPLTTQGELRRAWQQAGNWAESSGRSSGAGTRVAAATSWQLLFYRNNTWSNPQSSAGDSTEDSSGNTNSINSKLQAMPDGVRLTLTLAPGGSLQGVIVRDWLNPTVGGSAS